VNEFDLIHRLQRALCPADSPPDGSIVVGIGDDAAVLDPAPGQQLIVTTDTLNAGVHFPLDTPAREIGHKALAVNLSDLAAMGADPRWFFLNLSLPAASESWLDEFAGGLQLLATASGVRLCGGDTTRGPLSITITAMGQVPRGAALLRGTARAGDLVVVSGWPGRAALALRQFKAGEAIDPADWQALVRPTPRLQLGRALRGEASACVDLSDGLLADLGHIVQASPAVAGAELLLADLPTSASLAEQPQEARWALQLAGGDDYELCFTLPLEKRHGLAGWAQRAAVPLTVIGRLTSVAGMRLLRPSGGEFVLARAGYDHFPTATHYVD